MPVKPKLSLGLKRLQTLAAHLRSPKRVLKKFDFNVLCSTYKHEMTPGQKAALTKKRKKKLGLV